MRVKNFLSVAKIASLVYERENPSHRHLMDGLILAKPVALEKAERLEKLKRMGRSR